MTEFSRRASLGLDVFVCDGRSKESQIGSSVEKVQDGATRGLLSSEQEEKDVGRQSNPPKWQGPRSETRRQKKALRHDQARGPGRGTRKEKGGREPKSRRGGRSENAQQLAGRRMESEAGFVCGRAKRGRMSKTRGNA